MPNPDLSTPRQSLPDDFIPVQVIRCRWEPRYLPGEGRWEVVIQEHADGPATELMTELRRPSERSLFGQDCLDVGILVDYFVVVDSSGRAVLPDVPNGVCGEPLPSALAAIRSLPYHVDKQLPIRRVESEKAFRAGCSDKYPDILRRRERPEVVASRIWNPPPEGLRVCVYRITKKTPSTVGPRGMAMGKLESSRILKGSKLRTLLNALDAAPATDCPSNHTRFAVLTPGFWEAHVALDGCHNLRRPDRTLGRLTPDAAALLTK
ncbi:hypothetical protein [Microtetraspora malaysiensis]|uniref:Uncharacterized protein n=1 Tax=Microtetraspora malaysiensis TaxID=161358 RepID=A0ABW6T717_9ACTN